MPHIYTPPLESSTAQKDVKAGDVEMSDAYIHPDRLKAQRGVLEEEREKSVDNGRLNI
jgi:hypothetical protein